jgi:hypothetical protein
MEPGERWPCGSVPQMAGIHWLRALTQGSVRNHGYARRPVDAHPDFYAFWADGNPDDPSLSLLYFTNREGTALWQLPNVMKGSLESPIRLF